MTYGGVYLPTMPVRWCIPGWYMPPCVCTRVYIPPCVCLSGLYIPGYASRDCIYPGMPPCVVYLLVMPPCVVYLLVYGKHEAHRVLPRCMGGMRRIEPSLLPWVWEVRVNVVNAAPVGVRGWGLMLLMSPSSGP